MVLTVDNSAECSSFPFNINGSAVKAQKAN